MKIFSSGEFNRYKIRSIKESLEKSLSLENFEHYVQFSKSECKTTVFISHKHEDLEDLQGVIGFLKTEYNIDAYTDGNDSKMPKVTSKKTAERIREIIKRCDKFILLATNKAVESNWCNWELGFGDANKFPNNIAIFPINDKFEDSDYKGNEYMELYPTIVFSDGTDKYNNGSSIEKGYYVQTKTFDGYKIEKLKNWLNKKEIL